MSGPAWRKSSYSSNQGNCAEIADNLPEAMPCHQI